jgi:hypothetical protein
MKSLISTALGCCISMIAIAQNVGIGETIPLARLQIRSSTSASDANAMLLRNSSNDTLMSINNYGDVTIGSITRNYGRLEIVSNAKLGNPQLILRGTNTLGSNRFSSELIFGKVLDGNADRNFNIYSSVVAPPAGYSRDGRFILNSDSILNLLTITGGGDLGLGTGPYGPTARLDIKGNSPSLNTASVFIRNANDDSLLVLNDSGVVTIGSVRKQFGQLEIISDAKLAKPQLLLYGTNSLNTGRYSAEVHMGKINDGGTDRFWKFFSTVYSSSAGSSGQSGLFVQSDSLIDALAITGKGNVGIGNINPVLAGLVADRKVGAANAVFGSNTTGVAIESSFPGVAFNCYYNSGRKNISSGYSGLIGADPTNGDLYMYGFGNATAGSASPFATGVLLCQSNNSFIPYYDNNMSLGSLSNRWSTIYATNGVINTSDGRQKKNIAPLQYGLQEVLQMQPVQYEWRDGSSGSAANLGFIAQDMEKIVPEVVVKDQGVYGMNYAELIPVALHAIQQMESQLNEQRKKIEALETELKKIKHK